MGPRTTRASKSNGDRYPSASHRAMLNARLSQQSVAPGFPRGERIVASRSETAVQGADRPDLLRFTGAVNCGCGDAPGVLAVASVPSAEPEMLRCISGDRGQATWQAGRSNPKGNGLLKPFGMAMLRRTIPSGSSSQESRRSLTRVRRGSGEYRLQFRMDERSVASGPEEVLLALLRAK